MKKTPVFMLFVLWCTSLMSQTKDTTFISIGQDNAPMEKQHLADQYDMAFSTLEPTRWLFTLNLTALTGSQDDIIRAGAEVKILPSLSLHGSYGVGFGYAPANNFAEGSGYLAHRFGIEPRWYYAMARRIREGKSANNMSGNYIGLEAVYVHANTYHYAASEQKSFALRYGVQRRLFRHGFLDLSFGLGVVKDKYSDTPAANKWNLFANSQIGLGLALAQPKTTTSAGGYCDVLRCFREERQMWKMDLYNLVRINDLDNYKGQLSVGYERKIGTSPFSVEVQGEWSQERSVELGTGVNPYNITQNKSRFGINLQPQFYYAQKRRIARGKAGNNLSGVYVGTQVNWFETRDHQQGIQCGVAGCFPIDQQINTRTNDVGLVWGIQHRLFQHGFIDFSVRNSLNWTTTTNQDLPSGKKTSLSNLEGDFFFFKLRAGLAF